MSHRDDLCVNTLRFLAVDAVEAARSGHPGMPLGAAPMAYVLWDRFLKHNPRNPAWFNRDRFILSAGHGSALLYALLHVTGYDLPLEELKRFRQWGSRTPGHPEHGLTPGVETTTGPLGQGFANGVGMAMAERFLAHRFNKEGFAIVNHFTYAIVSDGDLMEGVASEAASLAGTWGLGKLIYLYDDNHITIEGDTDLAFTEDVAARFNAYGWHVQRVPDGNNLDAIEMAIRKAREEAGQASIIMIRTHLGFGSPKQDLASAHGEPLGPEAVRETKEALGWPREPAFYVPEEARVHFREAVKRGESEEREWQATTERYQKAYPSLWAELEGVMHGKLSEGWDRALPTFRREDGLLATRAASGRVLNALASGISNLLGGSADLAPSNKTMQVGKPVFGVRGTWGSNVHFGVREHAMAAIANGLALHGGIVPYVGTFLVFSDYMRPALRLAAMMRAKIIFIFTHDSIGVGEDGPTHQPVEQVMALRAIPGLTVIRPADANETAQAWRIALEHDGPVALVLTRQKLPILDGDIETISEGTARGAYVVAKAASRRPDIIIIATGSEVHLALDAREKLRETNVGASVVSMPSWEIFEAQHGEYKGAILPRNIPKMAVEAGSPMGWYKYVGNTGEVVGLERFGASAPGNTVFENLGINVDQVVSKAIKIVNKEEVSSGS